MDKTVLHWLEIYPPRIDETVSEWLRRVDLPSHTQVNSHEFAQAAAQAERRRQAKEGLISKPSGQALHLDGVSLYMNAAQTKQSNPKDSIGSTKLPFHLWPETATALGCLGLLDGELKYGRSNFRAVGVRASVYVDACRRHLAAWFEGEACDPDSGIPHLGHALACLAILVEAEAANNLNDDRNYPTNYRMWVNTLTPYVSQLQAKYADRQPPVHYTIRSSIASNLGARSE